MSFTVYILYSEATDQYYIGQTQDLLKRLDRHNSGTEISTARYRPWVIKWKTKKPTRSEAITLEKKIKYADRSVSIRVPSGPQKAP
jgi:putative endonuclease